MRIETGANKIANKYVEEMGDKLVAMVFSYISYYFLLLLSAVSILIATRHSLHHFIFDYDAHGKRARAYATIPFRIRQGIKRPTHGGLYCEGEGNQVRILLTFSSRVSVRYFYMSTNTHTYRHARAPASCTWAQPCLHCRLRVHLRCAGLYDRFARHILVALTPVGGREVPFAVAVAVALHQMALGSFWRLWLWLGSEAAGPQLRKAPSWQSRRAYSTT